MTETGNAYGNALFLLCKEEGREQEVLEQLEAVCQLLKDEPDYVRLLTSPNVKKAQRLELLSQAFEGKVDQYLLNFMCILAENNTFEELGPCAEAYRALYNDLHGVIQVTAVTAVAMTEAQTASLTNKLQAVTGKTVELNSLVDESCIGGVRLEMNGKRLDGSVKARLEALRETLLRTKA